LAIARALISVSDKTGVVDFAKGLAEAGIEIVSTGGTKKLLEQHGVSVVGISDVTGFPEILDGRVKTLHPAVHAGLLAVRDNAEHLDQMRRLGLSFFDLVAINLYPFAQTIADPAATFADAVENIDIGGPAMIRSAAKNHAFVTVVVDAADYGSVLEEIASHGDTTPETRRRLAAKAFRHTAAYDAMIAAYLTERAGETFPERLTLTFEKMCDLRYGENPHQRAAYYRLPLARAGTLTAAEQLHGKELSYNNIHDANAALAVVREFDAPAVAVIKHANPCGVGVGPTVAEAFRKARDADPVSIFGGIVAANRPIDAATARMMAELFLEVVLAPEFEPEALDILTKKKNLRLLRLGAEAFALADRTPGGRAGGAPVVPDYAFVSVDGGLLVQDRDSGAWRDADLRVVTKRAPTDAEWEALRFAWSVVKHVKSNAIVLARDGMTVGVGAGQMNRVGAARIAIEQAGDRARGAVMASDAFFPMGDTMELAAKAGVTAVVQPGGSIRDEESIRVADEHGIAMVFTGIRHFKH